MTKGFALLLACLAVPCAGAAGQDFSVRGELETRATIYARPPAFEDQSDKRLQPSTALTVVASGELSEHTGFTIAGFARAQPVSDERLSADLREGYIAYYGDDFELRAGVLSEFWGLLEGSNIVDIINQRDLVEDFEGDVKLGQPGVGAVTYWDTVSAEVFVLPYFRERRMAEGEDRLRISSLDFADAAFENSGDEWHPSAAGRVNLDLGSFSGAVSHFYGVGREPRLVPEFDSFGRPVALRPTYDTINQTGLEAQVIQGGTVWKLEAFHRFEDGESFFGVGAGLEHEFPNVLGTRASLTPYVEGYYDNRSDTAPLTAFDNDIFLGLRLALNNLSDTQFEATSLFDVENLSSAVSISFSTRISEELRFEASADLFINTRDDRALAGFGDDERFLLGIVWNF